MNICDALDFFNWARVRKNWPYVAVLGISLIATTAAAGTNPDDGGKAAAITFTATFVLGASCVFGTRKCTAHRRNQRALAPEERSLIGEEEELLPDGAESDEAALTI